MKGSVYLDACMIIDLVEGSPDQQERLSNALKGRNLVSSELARLESRIGALRKRQAEHLETYRRFFEGCVMAPMDRAVFDLAADLRVRYSIKTPDALHLAVALHAACGEIWTNDKRLASAVEGRIRIFTWNDIAKEAQQKQQDSDDPPQNRLPDARHRRAV